MFLLDILHLSKTAEVSYTPHRGNQYAKLRKWDINFMFFFFFLTFPPSVASFLGI